MFLPPRNAHPVKGWAATKFAPLVAPTRNGWLRELTLVPSASEASTSLNVPNQIRRIKLNRIQMNIFKRKPKERCYESGTVKVMPGGHAELVDPRVTPHQANVETLLSASQDLQVIVVTISGFEMPSGEMLLSVHSNLDGERACDWWERFGRPFLDNSMNKVGEPSKEST